MFKILLIDDNVDILFLQKILLESKGYQVCTANSGQEALDLLNQNDAPNLIILDVQMDFMSGPEFLLKLETDRPDLIQSIPVVLMTASCQPPPTKAVGFINKMIDIKEYLTQVSMFLPLNDTEESSRVR